MLSIALTWNVWLPSASPAYAWGLVHAVKPPPSIWLVKDGALLTPPDESGILLGITRQVVMDLARAAGIPVHVENLARQDVYVADECFLTGTGAEVVPVTSIDKRTIGSDKVGPITNKLMEAFHKFVREAP